MKKTIHAIAACAAVAFCPAAHAAVVVTALPEPLGIRDEFFGTFYPIDVDGNGTVDFTFGAEVSGVGLRTERANRAIIRLVGAPNIGGRLTPLEYGYSIASTLALDGFDDLEWASSDYLGGYVSEGENSFFGIVLVLSTGSSSDFNGRGTIGIEFEAEDGIHYGYLDISAGPGYAGITLYGWAYETEPGVPIVAGPVPEPSHAMLAGTGLIILLTRRTRKTSKHNKSLDPTRRSALLPIRATGRRVGQL